jgi:hypothetical protein
MSLLLALSGHGAMSDLSPLIASKQTCFLQLCLGVIKRLTVRVTLRLRICRLRGYVTFGLPIEAVTTYPPVTDQRGG